MQNHMGRITYLTPTIKHGNYHQEHPSGRVLQLWKQHMGCATCLALDDADTV